jgi:fatty acid desaturase
VHWLVVGLGIAALASGQVPSTWAWLLSVPIGMSFAGLTFLAHETLHGAIVRGRPLQQLVGRLGFLPFCITPSLWVAWHNRVHHGATQLDGVDPDAYPTLETYRASAVTRAMVDHVGASRGAPAGVLALLLGFNIQSLHMLVSARSTKMLSPRQHRSAVVETVLSFALWFSVGVVFGWQPFVFGFALPLLLANTIVMAHILTNHTLNPLTPVNDPLLNSLTVTLPGWAQWLTLGFGFHVEHHLYPWMSTRHAPIVRDLVCERWPERYQAMPLLRAIYRVYTTPRVYADDTTLIDPRTGKTWPALTPRLVNADAVVVEPREASERGSQRPQSPCPRSQGSLSPRSPCSRSPCPLR